MQNMYDNKKIVPSHTDFMHTSAKPHSNDRRTTKLLRSNFNQNMYNKGTCHAKLSL